MVNVERIKKSTSDLLSMSDKSSMQTLASKASIGAQKKDVHEEIKLESIEQY